MQPQTVALLCACFLNAVANVLIKQGVERMGAMPPTAGGKLLALGTSPWVVLGVASFGLTLLGYAYALSRIPLSVAYPTMTSLGYLLVILASVAFFAERLNALQGLGIAFLVAGLILVNRG